MADHANNSAPFEVEMDEATLKLAGIYALASLGVSPLTTTPEEEAAAAQGEESYRRQLAAREIIRRLLLVDQTRPHLGIKNQLLAIIDEARQDQDVDLGKKLAPIIAMAKPYLQAVQS
jgi:hypothetical protein